MKNYVVKRKYGYLELAHKSPKNKWGVSEESQNKKILAMYEEMVAYYLACNSATNGWAKTPAAHDKEVLTMCGGLVLKELRRKAEKSGWVEPK